MFEFLSPTDAQDAIDILKQDHDKVKELFEQFEKSESRREKISIAAKAIKELKIHATIEEEIFYPRARKEIDNDILNEADEEHHVAKVLIAELDRMNGSEDHYDAKFHVLAENIRHHIREEEGKMFPKARATDINFDAIGRRLLERKQELAKNGIPKVAEEKMVALMHGRDDSPAQNAKQNAKKTARKTRTHRAGGAAARGRKASARSMRRNGKVLHMTQKRKASSKSSGKTHPAKRARSR